MDSPFCWLPNDRIVILVYTLDIYLRVYMPMSIVIKVVICLLYIDFCHAIH